MIICPSCSAPMPGNPPACRSCQFSAVLRDGVTSFLEPARQDNSIEAAYSENYDVISALDLKQSVIPPEYAEKMNSVMADYVGDVSDAKICDLGCGRGMLSRILVERGAGSVTAVDISLQYLRKLTGTPKIDPVQANAEALPFQDEFDLIVSTDVLEHVLNAGSFYFCLNRALRINGRAIVRVPYRESLMPYSPHMGCPHRFVHFRSFDRPLLKQAFRNAGFEITGSRICGFFFGRAKPFWSRTQRRMDFYIKLRDRISAWPGGASSVAGWPYWLAGLLMEPVEIIIEARKVANLEPSLAVQARKGVS